MKALFKFDFDLLGFNVKLQVMTYENKKEVIEYFDIENKLLQC